MSGFVNLDNTFRPDKSGDAYGKVIEKIQKDNVCPFCPENLSKYHKNPILKEGKYWLLTNNMYPYEGAKYHAILIHKSHITSVAEISADAWAELKTLTDWFIKEKNIPGGALLLRFGDTAYTGASVSHLHAQLVSPDGEKKDRKPIRARIG
jgi:ATP adenylyltransferase